MDEPPDHDERGAQLGPAPAVRGRERIRAGARAALFGESEPSSGSEDTLAAGPRRRSSGWPEQIGRFRVEGELGHGGMGVVLRAHDPELDRPVAIKLLRPELSAPEGGEGTGASRLLREAQAMARLNHPNVIAVHEVGTVGDQVFVAMELVQGQTLGAWLRTRPPWTEVLGRFVEAGRGLAAAHAAGLVHRDFKPDNVLLGNDGRVRVVDFGLARAVPRDAEAEVDVETTEPDAVSKPGDAPADGDPLRTPLTRTGAVMGTPAYMSAEQHLGRAADARSDQFSLCVALWEGLFGERPFAGRSYGELVTNVTSDRRRPPPAGSPVPRWVVAVLERGLAGRPDDRFADMDALLAALERDPTRRWKRLGLGVLAAGVVSVATWAATGGDGATDACASVDEELAGVWDDGRRAAVRSAIMAVGAPWCEPVWQSTRRLLDAYADDWLRVRREACAAALVPGADEVEVERRAACVDARRAELAQLVDLLAHADAAVAVNAVEAAVSPSDVGACADPRRLAAWRAPADPQVARELASIRARLGLAEAKGALGDYAEARRIAQEVVDEARRLDDPATEAAALLVRGHEEARANDPAAEATLRRAVDRAEVSSAHAIRAEALIRLVDVVSRDPSRYDEAKALGTDAGAVLRVIGAEPLIRAKLDHNLGVAAQRAHHEDEALAHFRASLDAYIEGLGEDHPETAGAYASIGTVLSARGDYEEGEAYLRRAEASLEAVYGPEHPVVGAALGNLATNLARRRQYVEAIPLLERSLAIKEASLGPTHPSVVRTLYNLAMARFEAGRYEAAIEPLQRGLAAREAEGPEPSALIPWWNLLGYVQLMLGRFDEARDTLARAIEVAEASGTPPDDLTDQRFELAVAVAPTDRVRARGLVESLLPVLQARVDAAPDDPRAVFDLGRAKGWLAIDDTVEALVSAGRRRRRAAGAAGRGGAAGGGGATGAASGR